MFKRTFTVISIIFKNILFVFDMCFMVLSVLVLSVFGQLFLIIRLRLTDVWVFVCTFVFVFLRFGRQSLAVRWNVPFAALLTPRLS